MARSRRFRKTNRRTRRHGGAGKRKYPSEDESEVPHVNKAARTRSPIATPAVERPLETSSRSRSSIASPQPASNSSSRSLSFEGPLKEWQEKNKNGKKKHKNRKE